MKEIIEKLKRLEQDVPALRTASNYIILLNCIQNAIFDKKYEDLNKDLDNYTFSHEINMVCALIEETTFFKNEQIRKAYNELDAFYDKLESLPEEEYSEIISETNYNYYNLLLKKAYIVTAGEAEKYLSNADTYIAIKNSGEALFTNPFSKEMKEWRNNLKSYPNDYAVKTKNSKDDFEYDDELDDEDDFEFDADFDTLSIAEIDDLLESFIALFNVIENREAVMIQNDFNSSDKLNEYIESNLYMVSECSFQFDNLEAQEKIAELYNDINKYKTIEGDDDDEYYLNQEFYDKLQAVSIPFFETVKEVCSSLQPGEIEPEGKGSKKLVK